MIASGSDATPALLVERTSGDEGDGQDVFAAAEQTGKRAMAAGFAVVEVLMEKDVPGDTPWGERDLGSALDRALDRGWVVVVREVSRLSRFRPDVGRTLIEGIPDLEVLGRAHWSRRSGVWASDDDSAELLRLIDLWDSWREKRKTRERTQLRMNEFKDGKATKSGRPHHRPEVVIEPAHLEAARAIYERGGRGAMTAAHREVLRLRGWDDAKDPRTKKSRFVSKATLGQRLGVYSVKKPDASERGEAPAGSPSSVKGPLPDGVESGQNSVSGSSHAPSGATGAGRGDTPETGGGA